MHELGVVFHIMDSLESVAKENDVTQIQSVTIEIGEVSTVIPHYLTDCWEWAIKKKPLLTGCEMKVEILPAVTWCDTCRQDLHLHFAAGEQWLLFNGPFPAIGEIVRNHGGYLTDLNGYTLDLGDIIFFGDFFQRIHNMKYNTQLVHIISPSSWRT